MSFFSVATVKQYAEGHCERNGLFGFTMPEVRVHDAEEGMAACGRYMKVAEHILITYRKDRVGL